MQITTTDNYVKIKYGDDTFTHPLNTVSYAINDNSEGVTLFRNNEPIGTCAFGNISIDGQTPSRENIDTLLDGIFAPYGSDIELPISISDVEGLQEELDKTVTFNDNNDIDLTGKGNIILDKNKEVLGVFANDEQHVLVKGGVYEVNKSLLELNIGDSIAGLTLKFDRTFSPVLSTPSSLNIYFDDGSRLSFYFGSSYPPAYGSFTTADNIVTVFCTYLGIAVMDEFTLPETIGNISNIQSNIQPDFEDWINSIPVVGTLYQTELGNTSTHAIINSSDRPVIELPEHKEELAYISDIPDLSGYLVKNTANKQGALNVLTDQLDITPSEIRTKSPLYAANGYTLQSSTSATDYSKISTMFDNGMPYLRLETLADTVGSDMSIYRDSISVLSGNLQLRGGRTDTNNTSINMNIYGADGKYKGLQFTSKAGGVDIRPTSNGEEIAYVSDTSPASIKQKYETNPDTNVFTDNEKAKLASLKSGDNYLIKSTTDNQGALNIVSGDLTLASPTQAISLSLTESGIDIGHGDTSQATVNGSRILTETDASRFASQADIDRLSGKSNMQSGATNGNMVTVIVEDLMFGITKQSASNEWTIWAAPMDSVAHNISWSFINPWNSSLEVKTGSASITGGYQFDNNVGYGGNTGARITVMDLTTSKVFEFTTYINGSTGAIRVVRVI